MRLRTLMGALLFAGGSLALLTGVLGSITPDAGDDLFAEVEHFVSKETFDKMTPLHQKMLANIVQENRKAGAPRVAACWETNPNDADIIDAFNDAITGGGGPSPFFQLTGRWSSTALSGGGLSQGQPTIITYSFPPDGLTIPNGVGEGPGPNGLNAFMNSIYGNPTTWQNIFAQEFARIGAISGLSYVMEPNDDSAAFFTSPGVSGVRGDVRIAGKPIDGNSGILAYNFFPDNGDMVFDAPDSFYNTTTNDSRRLRNTIDHEHGHGTGLLHVCPADGTKLMEPFINTSFLGPQFDDLQAWQRHYGDPNEPNDSTGTATNLGTLSVGTTNINDVSIDDNSDTDYYEFSVSGTSDVSVTLTPVGFTYNEGPQTQSCAGGSPYNALTVHDVGVEILDSNGSTVLASADANPAGQAELAIVQPLPGNGPFYIRVTGDSTNNIQVYRLEVTVSVNVPAPFSISLPAGPVTNVAPEVPTVLSVQTTNLVGSPNPSTGLLFVSTNGGSFLPSPLIHLGGDDYTAVLPASPCFTDLDYFVVITSNGGTPVTFPAGAPTNALSAVADLGAVVSFNDDFETNQGWSVQNVGGLTDGAWDRGVPVGGGDRGDPAADFDGSGQCYLTDNADGNSDVDGGSTLLTSPAINLSGGSDPTISYAFWYDNEFGGNPNSDTFEIEISDNNGGTWVSVESYNANANAWVQRTTRVLDHVGLSNAVRMRFTASDLGGGSVVEAGLDAVRAEDCVQPATADPCADGRVGLTVGGPTDVLLINGSAGGPSRRVDIPLNSSWELSIIDPPTGTGVGHIIWGFIGVPLPADLFPITPQIGDLCFPPCPANPMDPRLFTVTSTVGSDGCTQLIGSTLTPWAAAVGPVGFPYTLTFQGLMVELNEFRTTNAVTVNNM